VKAEVDFTGYLNVVTNSFGNKLVGGSEECVSAIRSAFSSIDELIDAGQLAVLDKTFRTCQPLRRADVGAFVSSLAGRFEGSAQYNRGSDGDIDKLCVVMTDTSKGTPMERLSHTYGHCIDGSKDSFVNDLSNVTESSGMWRQWIYQTCTQFGYFQTCEPDKMDCMFSRHLSLDTYLDWCDRVFDLQKDDVFQRIQFMNEYYGGDQPGGSRILFVNGEVDPWHALSVLEDLPDDKTTVFIKGASHCEDMGENSPNDTEYMKEGKSKIEAKVAKWIKTAASSSISFA